MLALFVPSGNYIQFRFGQKKGPEEYLPLHAGVCEDPFNSTVFPFLTNMRWA